MSKWMYWGEVAAEVFPEPSGTRVAYCGVLSDPKAVANAQAIVADHNEVEALRAEVERLAREVSDYRDYFDASEPNTRRWASGNARTETLRQARAAIMSRRIDLNRDADPTTEERK